MATTETLVTVPATGGTPAKLISGKGNTQVFNPRSRKFLVQPTAACWVGGPTVDKTGAHKGVKLAAGGVYTLEANGDLYVISDATATDAVVIAGL